MVFRSNCSIFTFIFALKGTNWIVKMYRRSNKNPLTASYIMSQYMQWNLGAVLLCGWSCQDILTFFTILSQTELKLQHEPGPSRPERESLVLEAGCWLPHTPPFLLIRLSGQTHFLSPSLSSSRALHLIVMDTLHKSEGHMCCHRPPSVLCVRCKPSCRWAEVCFECSSQINPSFDEDDTGTDLSYWLDLKPGREMP